jgi:formylglycine-generating enzyme
MNKNKSIFIILLFSYLCVGHVAFGGGRSELAKRQPNTGVLVFQTLRHTNNSTRWTRRYHFENTTTNTRHVITAPGTTRRMLIRLPAGDYVLTRTDRLREGKVEAMREDFVPPFSRFTIVEGAITPLPVITSYYESRLSSHQEAVAAQTRGELPPAELRQKYQFVGGADIDNTQFNLWIRVDPELERELIDELRELEGAEAWQYLALHPQNVAYWPGARRITAQPLEETITSPSQPEIRESVPTELVQGGTFRMGSENSGFENERPVRAVTVSSFRMTRTEITVGQFRAFVNATGYRTDAETSGGGFVWTGSDWVQHTDATWHNPYLRQNDSHPVVLVSWFDAVYRIRGRNVSWNRDANGWRLPTEAEWEFAARGGTQSQSYNYAGSNDVNAVAWYRGNSNNSTQPVGTKAANELGLYDMSGNVLEWIWDWHAVYPSDSQTDPAGPSSGNHRVIRGGCWAFDETFTRPTDRRHITPLRDNHVGFRLVRTPVEGTGVMRVERTETTTRIGQDGLSIERTDETITRRLDPVTRVQFGTGSVDGSVAVSNGGSSVGFGAGLGYRGFNNRGNTLPGPEGGRGSGLDYQFFSLARLLFLNYEVTKYNENLEREKKSESDTILNLSVGAKIGWTWYTFNPMNQTDLTQSGRGFTIGLQGMVLFNPNVPDSAPGYSAFMFVPAPSFSFDRYQFNPATSRYRARSFYFFIWPIPFSAMLGYSFSL